MSIFLSLIALAGLMGLSALVAASETAFFSLRPWRVERLRRENPRPGGIIAEALRDPRVFLISLIIGTELVNVGVSNIAAMLRRRFGWPGLEGELGLIAGVVITSGTLVLLCDLAPKLLAVNFPESVAMRVSRPLGLLLKVLRPAAVPLARLTSFLTEPPRARAPAAPGPAALNEEDFRTLIEISRREGVLTPSQTEMIEAAFRLGDLLVRQVMVPRPDVVAIEESCGQDEALRVIRESRHSRVPVYRGAIDEVVGVLYAKDLLSSRFGLTPAAPLSSLVRPAVFVPEVMRARQLVRELQGRQVHLAIVVDEYGGTAGVVTLEDLLEEMVGEFADEFDRPIRVFRRLSKGVFWVRASMPLPEFNRRVRSRIKDPQVDTIGGYVLKLFDRVPVEGDGVSDELFTFTVRRMKGRRILVLLVQRRASGGAILPPDGRNEARRPSSEAHAGRQEEG